MDATHTDMKENCRRAILVGKLIRKLLPSIDLYIPAEHEDFVLTAYEGCYLTERQILEIDCLIIDDCDAVIFFLPDDDCELQGGRLVEYNHAVKHNIPIYKFTYVVQVVRWLTDFIVEKR